MLFCGCATALLTPFGRDGAVDFDALEKSVERQIGAGVSALVALGTTGEPSTLTEAERAAVAGFVVRKARGRVPVLVGVGSNCTAETVVRAKLAQALGADGLLVVTPYYNKCSQNGLVAHFRAVGKAVDIPVVCYNVPSRTGTDIRPTTYRAIRALPHIVAVKEACGDPQRLSAVAREKGAMTLYGGDDALVCETYEAGGKGIVSVAANLAPERMTELCNACAAGDTERARLLSERLAPLFEALFCEVSPIPLKAAATALGLCENVLRLPLTPLDPKRERRLLDAMRAADLPVETV